MTREIALPHGVATLVDEEDYVLYADVGFAWRRNSGGYVFTTIPAGGQRRTVLLHRLIAAARRQDAVDHINGDTLDNRRENLRRCSTQQNTRNRRRHSNNTTGYKGVYKKTGEAYRALIMTDGKQIALGYFDDPVTAAVAYDRAAVKLFGEYARPNFDPKRDWIFPQAVDPSRRPRRP